VIGRVSKDGLMVLKAMPTGRANARPMTGSASSGDARRRVLTMRAELTSRRGRIVRRQRRRALAGSARCIITSVEPAAEFKTDIRMGPDHLKSAP